MGKYRAKLNPFTGQLQLVNDIGVLFFKESVPVYVNLPITGNSKNDARIADDTGHLYVWSLDVPDGALTDWYDCGDIIDLKWAAIEGKPSSPVADIDDAVAKRHTQNSDTKLAEGTANEVTAANAKDAVDKKHTQGTDQKLDEGGVNEVVVADIKDAVDKKHEHVNKVILDLIEEALTTALKTAYDSAVADSHTHSNKVTLDAIQEAFTTALKNAYDSCVANEHTHANKTTLDNIEEAFTTALKSAYDSCVANEHTHSNKTTLDAIEEALTTTLKTAYDTAVSKMHDQNTDQYLNTQVKNVLYVDGNRSDIYTPNGSITKPFKKIQDAIDAIVSPSATNKHLIEIAPGAYYSDAITVNKIYTTFRSCGVQGARISGKITITNPADPTPHQITFVGLRISGGLECLASHTAINCVDCNVTGTAWVINPTVPTDDEYFQVWSGLYNVPTTLTNVYAYLMGGGYYCTFVVTNKEFNINNADINDPFEVTLNGTVIASAYGNRTGNSKFNLNAGATLNIDADTEGGSVITKDPAAILNRTTKAANIVNIPAGTIAATDVQAAINELDTEKTTLTDVKLDADIADAISKKHSQNTDIALRTDKLTVDVNGNTEIVGELKIKVYSQDTEPTLGADQRLAMWIDTNDSNRVYFIFRRGVGDQVLVELS